MNQNLLNSFQQHYRYKTASPIAKPFLDPARFLRNQIRQKLRGAKGKIEAADAFHLDRFAIVAGEAISEGIACHGIIEPSLTGALLRLVEPGQTALDIGMHLGYFSTLFAQLVGPTGAVHSFEPTPSTREIAAQNTSRFPNITVHPNAMWSHRTTMTFHDYGLAHMAFNSVMAARLDEDVPTLREFQVETLNLDEFRTQLNRRIDIIKIDAETAEMEILLGAEKLLTEDRPIVTLEVGDEAVAPGRSRELIEIMARMNYKPWEFMGEGFVAHKTREIYTYDNLIFSPSDRPLT